MGAQFSLLAALSPFALLGLRYPLRLLPIVLYEFGWKLLWFGFVAAPLYADGRMTEGAWSNALACFVAVVLTPIVVPWRYVWSSYVAAPVERWRARPANA